MFFAYFDILGDDAIGWGVRMRVAHVNARVNMFLQAKEFAGV